MILKTTHTKTETISGKKYNRIQKLKTKKESIAANRANARKKNEELKASRIQKLKAKKESRATDRASIKAKKASDLEARRQVLLAKQKKKTN